MKKFLTFLLIVILVLGGLEAVAISLDKVEYKTSTYLLDDELDQSQTEFESGVPIGNFQIQSKPRHNWTVAQSYTPSKEIQTRIQLLLSRNSTQLTIYPLVVCIREYLTGENIGMLSIEPDKVPEFPDFLWIEFDFEDMLMTIPHSYFIVCYTTNETDNCYLWAGKGNNSYPNGQVYFSYDDGATWDDGPPWDTADMCFKTYGRDNNRPDLPEIIGETNGKIQTSYEYTVSSIDPDGDDIAYYLILWDDDTHTNKTGPFASGESVTASHKWTKQGTYKILVRATDVFGKHSPWGTLDVTMPRNKAINTPFLNFLQQYPNLFPILRYILGAYIERFKPEKPEVAPEPPKDEPKDEIPVPAPENSVEEPPKEEKPAEPEEPDDDKPEKPFILELSMDKDEYTEGEQIPVFAILTNIGDETKKVSEMNFKTGTLDFYIDTPDGYKIHFIYPTNDSGMNYWTVKPKESRCIDIDITRGLFGISPSTSDFPYKFKEGCYTIVGYYKSYYVETPTHVAFYNDFWEGELESHTHEFTIISK